MRTIRVLVLIVLAGVVSGCRPPLHVATLQLGSHLNDDHTIATHTTRFKPTDRVFVATLTDQTGASTIMVRWFYNGQMVSEESRQVSYKGAAATSFEFKSAGAFLVGTYRVDVLVDGQPAATREFRVE
jgi:hypothetical protein